MREVWNWWKLRKSQLLVLVSFSLILVWQNIELRRGDGYFRAIVREVRESFRQQEYTRQIQFARLLGKAETHLSRLERSVATSRDEHREVMKQLRLLGEQIQAMTTGQLPVRPRG
jgi:hypothetical protein